MDDRSRSGHWLARTILSPRPPWFCNGIYWRHVGTYLAGAGFVMMFVPSPPMVGSMPVGVWVVAAGAGVLLLAGILYLLQETQRRYYRAGLKSLSAGKCHFCSYAVSGHNSARCPECAANIPAFIGEARWALDREQLVNLDDLARRT